MANSMMYENLLSRFALLEHRYLSCILLSQNRRRGEERYVLFECKNITFIIHLLITLTRITYIISNDSFHLHNSDHSLAIKALEYEY